MCYMSTGTLLTAIQRAFQLKDVHSFIYPHVLSVLLLISFATVRLLLLFIVAIFALLQFHIDSFLTPKINCSPSLRCDLAMLCECQTC